jgi:hypothetical protein
MQNLVHLRWFANEGYSIYDFSYNDSYYRKQHNKAANDLKILPRKVTKQLICLDVDGIPVLDLGRVVIIPKG